MSAHLSPSKSNSRYSFRNRNSDGHFDSQLPLPDSSPSSHFSIAGKKKAVKNPARTAHSENDDASVPSQLATMSTIAEEASQKKQEPQPITGKRKRRGAFSTSEGNVSTEKHSEKEGALITDENAFTERPEIFSATSLQDFLEQHFGDPHCHQCHQILRLEQLLDGHLQHWSSAYRSHTDISPSGFSCPTFECNATTCLGCNTQPQKADRSKVFELPVCCETGWYVSLWLFLSYFDSQKGPLGGGLEIKEEEDAGGSSSKSKKAKGKKPRGWTNPVPPKGTGYNDGHHFNDQYDGYPPDELPENAGASHASLMNKQDKRMKDDRREAALMTNIAQLMLQIPEDAKLQSELLSNSKKSRKTGKNKLVKLPAAKHGAMLIRSMFCWSKILKDMAEMFHNDSVEEAFKRAELYTAALDLVGALLQSEDTAPLVKERTYDAVRAFGVSVSAQVCPAVVFHPLPGKTIEDYEGSSIASSIENLVAAARALQETASAMPHVYSDKASKDLLDFCARIKSIGEQLNTADEDDTLVTPHMQDRRSSQDARARLEMVEESAITAIYRLRAKMNFRQAPAPKRMRSLFYELGILRTSLPEGIHAKVAISRPDVIKALIIGPQDTPYEGGLFEFDILCPEGYPNQPPLVECATAGRDEARAIHLNPNLYSSGYVCLSLIGTWHGSREEQWQPGRSTLLQVLVSIQSMILGTATPADNEPGGLGTSHKEFNKTIQAGTIQAALLPWLRNIDLKGGIWKDVVENHFKTNATNILETAKSWSKGNDRIKKWSPNPYYAHFADHGSPSPEEALIEADAEYAAQYMPSGISPTNNPYWFAPQNPAGSASPNDATPGKETIYTGPKPSSGLSHFLPMTSSSPNPIEHFPPPPPPPQPPSQPQTHAHHYHDSAGVPWNHHGYALSPVPSITHEEVVEAMKAKAAAKAKASSESLQDQSASESYSVSMSTLKATKEELMAALAQAKVALSDTKDKASIDGSDTSSSIAGASTAAVHNGGAPSKQPATMGGFQESLSETGIASAKPGNVAPKAGILSSYASYMHSQSQSHSIQTRRESKKPPKVQTVNLCEELERALAEYL